MAEEFGCLLLVYRKSGKAILLNLFAICVNNENNTLQSTTTNFMLFSSINLEASLTSKIW